MAKGGETTIRYVFLFLLIVPSLAAGQTTTTTIPGGCQHTTPDDLFAAASGDQDWQALMQYAKRKHFDTENPVNVVKCTEAPVTYFATLKNLHTSHPDAWLSYQPQGQALMHTRLLYYKSKSRRIGLDVTDALTVRVYFNPDGTLRRYINLDIHGHKLPTTVAPQARPRGFL